MDATGQRAGNNRRFKVGEWLVHPQLRELVSPDGKETVEARSVDILVALAEAAGEVLSRSELLELGWGDRFVGEEVLSHAIWDLRRALGDEPKTPRFIQTVHGKGYRLVAKVSWLEDGVGEQARYVLVEEIGRGAMGVVWRAQDPRLERDVAIKYLAPELRRDRDSEVRFLREARADARLDHPNICAVYEVDETDDGRMYLVMPLYTGQTLRERIDEGPLPWRDAVLIASQIAAGLGAAHEAGIVHRDLKPSNVMLTPASPGTGSAEGSTVVKILDFGLAKLRGMSRLTVAGSSLGTPSYMSPELASQEDAGPESDLWALGVLLYEMLVGHCPFRGGNPQAVIHSILGAEPEPMPADLELPSELRELVNSLLVKEPADRPSDATGIAGALLELLGDAPPGLVSVAAWSRRPLVRRASTWVWAAMAVTVIVFGLSLLSRKLPAVAPAGSPDPELSTAATPRPHPNSIVVLPLANRSSDPEQEYFSDGISEELLNLLTRIPELRVTSRTSAFSFKGQSLSAPEIARRLNVANVLEGSVRRDGDQVRISVQLIDAVSDTPRWSESYHRTLEDIFAIQDEIAADVATQLEVQLLGDPPTVEKVDPVAYELILQARRFANRSTADGLESAGQLLRRAIAIDPDSATAWAELAGVYSEQTGVGERSSTEGVRLAREATDRALAIDPNHVLALVQLSTIARMFDQDLAAAARYTSRPSASNLTTNWRSTLLAC